ncbi:MAG: hypothetical protein K6A67_00595 [Bacteroidales bacterium]|nr:hypothetical protein [Bacteroidales bacterium]
MKYQKVLMYFVGVVALVACGPAQKAPQVEGHYTYEHVFDYDMDGNHFDVSEVGTMDFYANGTALDSARQVYHATLADGDTTTWVYKYISPSRWHLNGDTLFFAGIKENFRMEVVDGEATELTQKISDTYSRSIDYEYKFHIDTLTTEKLQWSFTYRDGHSDTWTFFRK